MDLSQFTTEELLAIKAGDLSKLSTEKLLALKGMAATQGAQPEPAPLLQAPSLGATVEQPVEPQRMRMTAQGATLGWSDELEAMLRSALPGAEYEPTLQKIRGEINAYKKAQPGAALMYEMAGAAAVPGIGSFKALSIASPTLRSLLWKLPTIGAVEGGLTAAGTGEGDIFSRAARVPAGAGYGSVLGPAGYLGGKAVGATGGAIMNPLLDMARRKFGNQAAGAVERQIQDMVKQTGMTHDEVIKGIMRGDILAENATIQDLVRALARGGGSAETVLREALTRRPGELRAQSIEELSKYLAPGMNQNVRKTVTMTDEQAAKQEAEMYRQAYEQGGVITKPLLDSMTDALKRTKGSAANMLEEAYTAQTGKTPFFKVNEKGEVAYSRAPTLEDFELVRRSIKDIQNQAYTSGRGAAGAGYREAEQALRGQLDVTAPAVGQARAAAAQRRSAQDAFDEGKRIFGQNADQVSIDFEKIRNDPNQLKYYRAGLMDAIRARMATGNKMTTLQRLADETTKEGQILRTVFPGDQLPDVLQGLSRAALSAKASGAILGGSATAPTQMAAARLGTGADILQFGNALVSGNPLEAVRTARNLVSQLAPKGLTDSQKQRVAEILVSQDPQMISRVLNDQQGAAKLQAMINQIIGQMPAAGLGIGGMLSGVAGPNMGAQ